MEKDLPQLVLKKKKKVKSNINLSRYLLLAFWPIYGDASSFTLVCRRLELGCISYKKLSSIRYLWNKATLKFVCLKVLSASAICCFKTSALDFTQDLSFFFYLPSSLFVLSDLSHSSLHRKSVKEHSGGAVMRKLDPSGKLSRSNLSRRATNVSNTLGGWAHTAANTICKHNWALSV